MRYTSGAYFGLKLIVVNYPLNNKLYDCVFFKWQCNCGAFVCYCALPVRDYYVYAVINLVVSDGIPSMKFDMV